MDSSMNAQKQWMLRTLIILSAAMLTPEVCRAMEFVVDGRPAAKVVIPDDANPVTALAAEVLVRYVAESTGAKLEIVSEKDAGGSGERIFLGATAAAQTAGVDVSKIKYDGFIWKTVGNDLIIAGRDVPFASAKGKNNLQSACHGTARGVYRLLEDYGGVRWLLPTPKGVVVPKAERFSVPDGIDRREEPLFAYTLGLSNFGEWSLANGQRRAVDVLTLGHSWDGALREAGDPKALFDKEPERFALIDGKRHYTPHNFQLCSSHPDFINISVQYFSKLFDKGHQWVEYNQADGWRRCECGRCNAMDRLDELEKEIGAYWNREADPSDKTRAPAERLWVPFGKIAERLYKKYPDHKIVPLAYHPTFIPSQAVKHFPPNVMIAMTREYPGLFEQFSGFDKTIWAYWWGAYHVSGLTPNMMAHQVIPHLNLLVDQDVLGVYSCGGGALWGLEGGAYYVYSKLSWNPTLDPDAVLDDYYRGVYHAAAPEMKRFFDLIESRVTVGKDTQTVKQRAHNLYNRSVAVYFPEAYPPAVLANLDSILAQAKAKAAGDDLAGQWLALTELQYRYLKIVANGFTLYREYRFSRNKTPALRGELAAAIEARESFIAEVTELKQKKEWLTDWFPGAGTYMATLPTGGSCYATLNAGPPFGGSFAQELTK